MQSVLIFRNLTFLALATAIHVPPNASWHIATSIMASLRSVPGYVGRPSNVTPHS